MDILNYEKLLRTALARGGDYADIFVERRKATSFRLEDRKIENASSGMLSGTGIRLIRGRKTAYAYSNDFSETTLSGLASTVAKSGISPATELTGTNLRYPKAHPDIRIIPDTVPHSRKIALMMKIDGMVRCKDPRIRQVSVVYADSVQSIMTFSSLGFCTEEDRSYALGYVHVTASDGPVIQTGYESIGGMTGYELFMDGLFEEAAMKAADRAVMMLKARRIEGGRMPVVISSESGGTMIHEAIGHGLEADLAREKLSVYSGRIGTQIASKVITVADDATLSHKRGSFRFDDEGTPSGRNVLVRDGILLGYLYDRHMAILDGVTPTGNGRRMSYANVPIPRMTNTYVVPGTSSPQDVIRSVDKGFYVMKMGGGQVNTVTGDFVFEIQEGYRIEGGDIGEPVQGATLIGNGPAVLQSIDMVASDLGFSIGTCGKDGQGVPVSDGMPTLRIPEIVVGGAAS